jgi:hypothetical protein
MTLKRADPQMAIMGMVLTATSWDFRQQGRDTKLELDGEDDVYLLLIEEIVQGQVQSGQRYHYS